jgi:guanylate kinase
LPINSMHASAPFLLLISAPSGAGKTTVSQGLMSANPRIGRIITCASRAPRPGEVHGVDYHFFSRSEFEARIAAGEFLEYANVYGDWKGILKESVRAHWATGKDALLSVDVQGAETVRRVVASDPALVGRLVTVFITPVSRQPGCRWARGHPAAFGHRGGRGGPLGGVRLSFGQPQS